MARLEYFVVSRSVAVDQVSNQTSILEILEEVQARGYPAVIPSLVATSLWRKEPEDEGQDFQVLLRITTPSGITHEFATGFRIAGRRHRVTQRIEGLSVEQDGELRFEALLNGKHAAEHIVDVYRIDMDDATQTPANIMVT